MLRLFSKSKPEPENPTHFLQEHSNDISGSLCIFGDWFGRPMDNCHRLVSFETKQGYLKLSFDQAETLEIWNPQGLKKEKKTFSIHRASRVRWEWFYYGRPHLPENRFAWEHVLKDGLIEATSNASWYSPDFKPSLLKPAVSIQ